MSDQRFAVANVQTRPCAMAKPHAVPPTPCFIKSLLGTLYLIIMLFWELIDTLTLHGSQTVPVVLLQCTSTNVPGLHLLQQL